MLAENLVPPPHRNSIPGPYSSKRDAILLSLHKVADTWTNRVIGWENKGKKWIAGNYFAVRRVIFS